MSRADSERITTLDEASRWLDGLINHERSGDYVYSRLDLKPIEALLDAIGRPHERLSVVHVAGSKGKGSTCLLTESILGALGEHVGTFTSPHLESWIERFRLGGREVEPERLVAAVVRVRPAIDRLREGPLETRPSFFDATTAIAFLMFAEAGVDRAIIEVGLGGRLDSTNVVRPSVTCITSIELEHTDKLGTTEAAIAGEKAGILKSGVPAVLGVLGPEAAAVIRRRASEVGAPVFVRGEDFDVRVEDEGLAGEGAGVAAGTGTGGLPPIRRIRFASRDWAPIEAELSAPGEAAVANAALAIACVRELGRHTEASIRAAAGLGLARAVLPGRLEVLASDPDVVIDAAHTARSAAVAAASLASLAPGGYDLLFSISTDKDVEAVLAALLPGARRIWLTRADRQRSVDPEALAARVRGWRPELPIEVVAEPEAAALRARAALPAGRRLCVIGSVYLAGAARRVLGRARS